MNQEKIDQALQIIKSLGFPKEQHNERSALCLLALLNLSPDKLWNEAEAPLIGITPIMEFAKTHYGKLYAPNTRETFRRQTMHQFVNAGLALYNPDDPHRPVNSPKAVYQISPQVLDLLRQFGSKNWVNLLYTYVSTHGSLIVRYARVREQVKIPVRVQDGMEFRISPGEHSLLIKNIIEEFAPRFTPGSKLIYAGDTGNKWGYFDEEAISSLGITLDPHGKIPDVILYWAVKNWLVIIESVTSHGPINPKRRTELEQIFSKSKAGVVYVTAFPNRSVMGRYLGEIAWETEVWVADAPSHLIHFNGDKFLGPH